jgi:hypothetical protein
MIPASQKANSSAWWRSGADKVIPAEVTAEYAKYAKKPEHRQGNGDNLSPKSLGFDPQRFTTDAASWHPTDTAVDCIVITWGADRGGPPWCYGTDRSCVPKTARLLSPAATPSRTRRTQWAQFAHTALLQNVNYLGAAPFFTPVSPGGRFLVLTTLANQRNQGGSWHGSSA